MARVTPFMMFQGQAEDAINLYISVIADSEILAMRRYGADGPGKEGSVMAARLRLGSTEVLCSDSSVEHAFNFTPSISLFIDCEDEVNFQRITIALSEGGQFLMPPNNYGFSRRFSWLNDRFGVSWQVNLP